MNEAYVNLEVHRHCMVQCTMCESKEVIDGT